MQFCTCTVLMENLYPIPRRGRKDRSPASEHCKWPRGNLGLNLLFLACQAPTMGPSSVPSSKCPHQRQTDTKGEKSVLGVGTAGEKQGYKLPRLFALSDDLQIYRHTLAFCWPRDVIGGHFFLILSFKPFLVLKSIF